MNTSAVFSLDRTYRYQLWREWDSTLPTVMFIGLNPSTADETKDDPTIRRCIGFAKSWGHGSLCMTNLFAFRATDPADMMCATEPIGSQNNRHLMELAETIGLIIAAWGTHGVFQNRASEVLRMWSPGRLHHLGLTKDGHPKHPLYLKADLKPILWK